MPLLFGALAVALAGVAIFLAVRQANAPVLPEAPPAQPGENEYDHVRQALEAEDLEVDGDQRRGLPVGPMSVPGQLMTVEGQPLYVFVYQRGDPVASAEADASAADPTAVLAAASRSASAPGTATATNAAPPRIFAHSNVAVALVGGSNEVAAKVERAVQRLP